MKKKNKKQFTRERPKTTKAMVMAINFNKKIDERTRAGKIIREVKTAVQQDLSGAAKALLESDIANAVAIQEMALRQAYSDPTAMIRPDGKLHYSLNTWAKFRSLKKVLCLPCASSSKPSSRKKCQNSW